MSSNMMGKRPKVVIIGGGFGGIYTAKNLRNADLDIVLIDKTNHHLFQPLLYQVATAALSPADIGTPIRKLLGRQKNCLVLMSDVFKIDKKCKRIYLLGHAPIHYDILVVAAGASHSYFGNDHWAEFAPGLKTLDDALTIREKIISSFEHAELCKDRVKSQKFLNFAIIGGGPTGVELAGAIAEIANHTILLDFKRIDPSSTRVYLIEGLPNILPAMPESLSKRAKKDLEKLGVEVITGKMVTKIDEHGIQMGDVCIESTNIIWAAGNQASPLLKTLDVPLDRQGRVITDGDLSVPGNPEIFVIGDAAHSNDLNNNGMPLPAVAPVAIQQADYLSTLLKKNQVGKGYKPFKYLDKGTLATIGRSQAVAKVAGIQFAGFLAWCIWSFIHLMYLIQYKNRLIVLMEWTYGYFTKQRGARLVRYPAKEGDEHYFTPEIDPNCVTDDDEEA